MSENLYEQELWDQGYEDFSFFTAGDADPVKQFILKHLPADAGTAFEVGCFPGRYLAAIGEKGWQLNGVDLTGYLPKLESWLREKKCSVGNFAMQKFENTPSTIKYDLVYSCGFIEHFSNFEEIILKHALLVKDNGTIIITTPNFNGIQGFLHRFLDDENYKRHNVKSMNLKKWRSVLEANGFNVDETAYFGKFAFWHGWQSRPYYKRFFLYRFMKMVPFLERVIKFNSRNLSPFCGIAARKTKGGTVTGA